MAAPIKQPEAGGSRPSPKAVRFQDQLQIVIDDKSSAAVAKAETTEERILKQPQENGRKMDMMAKQIKGIEKALEGQAAINKKLLKNFDDLEGRT